MNSEKKGKVKRLKPVMWKLRNDSPACSCEGSQD